jgi:bifunctional UDP-N-acetylglucosamine pyrophosphorylase/glucosamine-1-phosphate N-acetyltransferase
MKKTSMGKGAKANHLAYLGDSTIGAGANIGAGTITCNYDGVNKHQTIIEDGAFIGSDSQLVAPFGLARAPTSAPARRFTKDVPADALAVSRTPQLNKAGWASKQRAKRAKGQS